MHLKAERGGELDLPFHLTVRAGTLDPVDVPAGPFGHTIDLPWYEEESQAWNRALASKSLAKLRDYGFTTATGLPVVQLQQVRGEEEDGVPAAARLHAR